mgnify:FL=1
MVNKNFWDLLREKQGTLTKSGTIIADYLTRHAEEAQFLSISSLAKECNMAEATIYRFCKQLGFEGYNEMKIALAQANVTPTPFSSYSLDSAINTPSLCDNVYASFMAAINSTISVLDSDAIDEAALLLQRATSVYCLGQGGSMVLANDIWIRFATISNKFRNCGDSHTQLIAASLMGAGDVILFVSYSGATHDMMQTLTVARKAGAKIILITHYPDAPGAALADVVLVCGGMETPLDCGSIPVKVAALFVAETLVMRYSLDNRELTKIAKDKTSLAMATKLL